MTLTLAGITLHEFDVAATDLLLCFEAWTFALLLSRRPAMPARLRTLAVALFATLGLSSLLGAAFHAFFPEKAGTTGGYLVWIATGISIALTTSVVWTLDALLLNHRALSRAVSALVPVYFAAFVGVLVFVDYRFKTIISFYAPAVVALAVIAVRMYAKSRGREALYLVLGTGLSFAAAAVQVLKVDVHPQYFNFNALYHLIQGIALAFLFASLRLLRPELPQDPQDLQSRGRSGSS